MIGSVWRPKFYLTTTFMKIFVKVLFSSTTTIVKVKLHPVNAGSLTEFVRKVDLKHIMIERQIIGSRSNALKH